jgi:hypothetical protein
MSRRKKSSNEGMIIWAFIIGIPAYLMIEYPIIFWIVFVPLVTLGVVKFITWLKR